MQNKAGDCTRCVRMQQIVNPTIKNIEASRKEYQSFGAEWRKDLFNEMNGGYLITHKDRFAKSQINNTERIKYSKEHNMAVNLANAGYKVKFLKDGERSIGDCDITLNNIYADLKKVKSPGNVRHYAGDTFGKKGGKIVVYEFEKHESRFLSEINNIRLQKGQKIIYYYSDKPDVVYVIEKK